MHIGELSRRTGISVRSLRYYEQKNLIHSERLENSYRIFEESVIERVKIIQMYLGLGLTTDEISKILECPVTIEDQQPLCDKAVAVYEAKLKEINEQINLLEKLRTNLENRISNFRDHQ